MARPLALVVLTALAPVSSALPLHAQEYRADPFRPTTTQDEERRLQDEERNRKALRDLIPEIRAKVMEDMESQRSANVEATKRAIIEALKTDPAFAQRAPVSLGGVSGSPGIPSAAEVAALGQGASMSAPAAQMVPTPLPEGAEFVACLNGKELYRDTKEHTRFIRELPKNVVTKCGVDRHPAMSPKKVDVVAAAGQAIAGGAAALAGGPGPMPSGIPGGAMPGAPMPGGAVPPAQPNAVAVPRPVLPAGSASPAFPGSPGTPTGPRPAGVPVVGGSTAPSRPVVPPPVVPGAAAAPTAPKPVASPATQQPSTQPPGATQSTPGGPMDMSVGYRYPRPVGN